MIGSGVENVVNFPQWRWACESVHTPRCNLCTPLNLQAVCTINVNLQVHSSVAFHPNFISLVQVVPGASPLDDKVSMLTHIYPHKARRKIDHMQNHQADSPLYVWPYVWSADLHLLIKSMVIHDTECPYWDQVSLNNTSQTCPRRNSALIVQKSGLKHRSSIHLLLPKTNCHNVLFLKKTVYIIVHESLHEVQREDQDKITRLTALRHCV